MTTQEQMHKHLAALGIPYKEIQVYGHQIMITCHSRDAAIKFQGVLAKFAKINGKGAQQSLDYAKVNKNTVMKPSTVKVWRVWATI